jgi:hypothetical protein
MGIEPIFIQKRFFQDAKMKKLDFKSSASTYCAKSPTLDFMGFEPIIFKEEFAESVF